MFDRIEEYIEGHVSCEPELLRDLYRHTHLHHLYGRMCSGNVQGRLLKMLTTMIAPRRVLELGTFTGYSALCVAEGLPDGGVIHTVEIDDEQEDNLREWFGRSEYGDRVVLHIGDAMELIEEISGEPWDMVIIDANKRIYIDYYEMVLPHVRRGGFIIADNTLWGGKVIEEPTPTDAQTRGIMAFNDHVAGDNRVEVAMVAVRDGLTLIRKR